MCEVGVLEKVRRGVYRLHPERHKNLTLLMWTSREFKAIANQRADRKKRREEYRRFLGIEEGEFGDEIELTPDEVEELMEWNEDKDWEEVEPYILAHKLGISISEARALTEM